MDHASQFDIKFFCVTYEGTTKSTYEGWCRDLSDFDAMESHLESVSSAGTANSAETGGSTIDPGRGLFVFFDGWQGDKSSGRSLFDMLEIWQSQT